MARLRNLDYHGFYELLVEQLSRYRGEVDEIVQLAPDLFRFLTNLLEDTRVTAPARRLICAALAYFVAPYDVEPEEIYGPRGFVDDVYLCASVARALRTILPADILETAWEAEFPFEETIDRTYERASAVLGERARDVLRYVGLD
ncbi:DUF1232 domain-containing protein [Thermomicrobium sp. 4228-Ro]|uniref:YkvA family protein n=1 Tax=Thermomicrobium sp. 4228-Ro TaxID=2993937 RepID=UPI002248F10C|nr:DUF1232 domain-containing protein [Thermomicrobium sp. 4228-Ro]MCX2728341.1 DUF1232 domain-containing protein [Thermomicrobium sp. 4228-Ro]